MLRLMLSASILLAMLLTGCGGAEPPLPTLVELPTATATDTIPSTETPIPMQPTQSPYIVTNGEDVSFMIEGVFFTPQQNTTVTAILATMVNHSTRNRCYQARDVRLILDGSEYAPDSGLMGDIKDLLNRDYLGAFSGQCVDGNETALTFVAFNVPMAGSNAILQFSDAPAIHLLDDWRIPLPLVNQQTIPIDGFVNTIESELTAIAAWTNTPVPSATNTDLPSATSTITNTPAPSPTQSAEDVALGAFIDVFGRGRADDIETFVVNERVVTMRFPLSDLSAYYALRDAELQFPQLVCALRDAGFTSQTYQITGTIGLVDSFGNSSRGEGVEMIIEPQTFNRINCEAAEAHGVDLSQIAERWDVHQLLQD